MRTTAQVPAGRLTPKKVPETPVEKAPGCGFVPKPAGGPIAPAWWAQGIPLRPKPGGPRAADSPPGGTVPRGRLSSSAGNDARAPTGRVGPTQNGVPGSPFQKGGATDQRDARKEENMAPKSHPLWGGRINPSPAAIFAQLKTRLFAQYHPREQPRTAVLPHGHQRSVPPYVLRAREAMEREVKDETQDFIRDAVGS